MSQNNPIRLFITHAWETSDEYLRIFEYLESARNFFYKNFSAPDKAPSGGKEADREELRRQIAQAECVIALPGLYRQQSDLMLFEMTFAKASDKPVILMRPFGANAVLPNAITSLVGPGRRVGRARAGRCGQGAGAPRGIPSLGHHRIQAGLVSQPSAANS